MIPHERALAERLKDKPFTLLGINSDESRSALKKIRDDEKITWPQIYDGTPGQGPIAKRWNVHAWPTIFILDHEGVIRYRDLRGEAMEAAILELVAKVPTPKRDSQGQRD
jgi:hypothetical protein